MAFCKQCGAAREETDKFCGTCGSKRESKESILPTTSTTSTLKDYTKYKGRERSGFFKNNKRQSDSNNIDGEKCSKKKDKAACNFKVHVIINVGIVRLNEQNELVIVRGSKLPIKLNKTCSAAQVLHEAINKHANHDQFFCALEHYALLYPDQKIVVTIPGSDEYFTVEKYKAELAKPYSKVDLYICKVSEIHAHGDDYGELEVQDGLEDNKDLEKYQFFFAAR